MFNLGKPNYIYHTKGSTSIDKESNNGWEVIRRLCLCCVAIIVISSIVFKTNILGEMSGYSVGVLLALLFLCWVKKEHEWVDYPVEFWFYDDALVVYKPCKPYDNGKKSRQEWYYFKYADIKHSVIDKRLNTMNISGIVHGIYIWYGKDGELTDYKKYDKVTDSGCIIYIHYIDVPEIVRIFKEHSPIELEVNG